ncbi:DUF1266 domain-containing protein [Paenibacillus oralis]|uniref:DUF1266 domain-containing protein n=1 Tax=Paenibacillus oralis TaxID=2490856 RepID=A0A3P3U0M8_9BACL|nr:DUF1266 domain-containing protein [Paenibacillus oralis]RRJ63907.1 DUF1266 domain-containing protein [Paenibacillus oralis]
MLAVIPVGGAADYYINNPEKTYRGERYLKGTLAQHGVENPEQLKMSLEWQFSKGIRAEFSRMYRELCLLPEAERARRIEAEASPYVQHKLAVTDHYLRRMPSGGVGAYDFAVNALKCVSGERLGWLTADEARTCVHQCVSLTREHYSNWHDYCIGFAVGLEFVSIDPNSSNYVIEGIRRLRRLLNFKDSPLVKEKFF